MFICSDCLRQNYSNADSLSKSNGRCEDCGNVKVCNDISSDRLVPRVRTIGTLDPMTGLLRVNN